MRRLTAYLPDRVLMPFFAVMGLFFVLPLCLVVAYSFLKSGAYGGVTWQFSLDAYIQFFYRRELDGSYAFSAGYLEIFWRSLKLAGICTLLCALVGFPMAYYMATRPARQRNFWIILVTIPFFTNLLIRTYAWILLLRSDGLVNRMLLETRIVSAPLSLLYNDFAVGLGLLYSYLPFMILPLYASLERLDWRLVEAAQDLYASRLQVLRRVIIPLAMPGIAGGALLVFIPAIGSFLAADLLGGGKRMMISNLIEAQFGFSRNWPFGAAASVILIVIVMAGMFWLARRQNAAAGRRA